MKNFLDDFDFNNTEHLLWVYYYLDQHKPPVRFLQAGYLELNQQELFVLLVRIAKLFIWKSFQDLVEIPDTTKVPVAEESQAAEDVQNSTKSQEPEEIPVAEESNLKEKEEEKND